MNNQQGFIWHPLRNNVLDHLGEPLVDNNGRCLKIEQRMTGGSFVVYRDNEVVNEGGNLSVCFFLNSNEVRPT